MKVLLGFCAFPICGSSSIDCLKLRISCVVEMLVHNMQYFFSLEYDIQGFKAKGSHVKSLEALENIQLADDDHHVLCILCKQLSQNKKTFIKVGGQVGTQGLRNHLRGAHPQETLHYG